MSTTDSVPPSAGNGEHAAEKAKMDVAATLNRLPDGDRHEILAAAVEATDDAGKAQVAKAALQAMPTDGKKSVAAAAAQGVPDSAKRDIVAAAVRAADEGARTDILGAAAASLTTAQKEKVAGELVPDQHMTNRIWLTIVRTFAIVLICSTLGLVAAVVVSFFRRVDTTLVQMLLTLFTTVAGILAGFVSGRASAGSGSR